MTAMAKPQGTAAQMRKWTGPAVLSYGFRPFFFGGAVWAAMAMTLWVAMLSGVLDLPTRFDPVSWHAHAFLFGYLGAIFAGFLLTAIPNWTGRLPVIGWSLGGLVLLWIAGRMAVLFSEWIPWSVAAIIDVAFPIVLGGVILREIMQGQNWKNFPVLALLLIFAAANGIFHIEAAEGSNASQGYGLRLGLAVAVTMISLIGGRIVPSFTRNWLAKAGGGTLPAAPMQRFDKIVLLVTIVGLVLWVAWPGDPLTGAALIIVGFLHLGRLARWRGWRTHREPLVWVLHIAYGFVPLGALAIGATIFAPNALMPAGMQHLWMAGAIGLMTLAVITRATLGHSGQPLHAGPGTTALYAMLIGSIVARLVASVWPMWHLVELAGVLWIGTFSGYAILYGPLLWRSKPAQG